MTASALAALMTAGCLAAIPVRTAGALDSSTASRIALTSQSTYVLGQSSFHLGVTVSSPLQASGLGVQLTLYSPLPNRTNFSYSLSDHELPSESCESETAVLPLSEASNTTLFDLPVTDNATIPRCNVASSSLGLNCTAGTGKCSGVYPLQVALVQRTTGSTLSSFTTHVIELENLQGLHRLQVALVVPVGNEVALAPDGTSLLTASSLRSLDHLVSTLSTYSTTHLTLALYPQLLDALAAKGANGVALLHKLDDVVKQRWSAHSLEPLDTPYAPYDASALASAGLSATLADQLRLGTERLSMNLGRPPALDPYDVTAPLDSNGDNLLASLCATELVLPSGAISSTSNGLTQTAPVLLHPAKSCGDSDGDDVATTAFVADSSSSLLDSHNSDSSLVAHQFIAELAQIYFEAPNATPRAVVVAPTGTVAPKLLAAVLDGLRSAPFVRSQTLGSLYSRVPVGADDNLSHLSLPNSTGDQNVIPSGRIADSRRTLKDLQSLLPNASLLLTSLNDTVELGESSSLVAKQRDAYLDRPSRELKSVADSLSFLGSRSVTLTASTGNVPITVHQGGSVSPVSVIVRLVSSELLFPDGRDQLVSLSAKDTPIPNARVETRGSISTSHLYVELLTPVGDRVLLRGTFTVRSRAISGVAVAISGVAVAVLLVWWFRSVRRRRARRRAPALS